MGATIVNRAKPYQALSAQSSYKSGLAMARRLSFFPAMKLFLLTLAVACALVAATPANRTSLLPQVTISETPEGRIVLGYPAPEGKAPYIVGLLIRTDGSNGAAVGAGTIIANNWVLTAAHCLTTDSVDIHYGSNWGWNGAFSHNVRRDNFISHPDWPSQAGRDIGLIRTPHVDFNNLVNKIPLPSFSEENERFQDTWCVACGWGGMDNGNLADWLQCIDVQIISNSECESAYGSVSGHDMCTRQSDGRSVCGGDSGGPLVTHDNARLVGVITFASVSCHNGPSGYTRVTDYLGWIRDHTGISY